ncbi:hypothetical protein NQ314_021477 [Rhamnusium bicolor]|uniref:Uncharacterized protein n=1 Tax=Rhamnusium bicolor TaxID=1586634 RepID=A0AAV8WI06_9CUCU|nr:hypothetical protein NQ314_021477 [Rhamnusium bicolor]
MNLDNKVLTFTMKMPKLEQIAKYNINGKIMVLPVYGSGDSKITLSGAKIIHTIKFKEEIKNKKVYFKIISYRVEFTVENAHFQFENLFNGDKQLAENILKVLNENGRVLFEDASEGIDKSYAEVYKNIATRFFQNVPVDDIFLP